MANWQTRKGLITHKNKGLPTGALRLQTGIRVRITLSRKALDTARRGLTRVMTGTLVRTSFQSLSAQKICINRALLECFGLTQSVPKQVTTGETWKINF
jgi:hypothetical protein